jgi:diguanylate cyclase (GGDEF)-like protein/PAS domain S-box-containing protein
VHDAFDMDAGVRAPDRPSTGATATAPAVATERRYLDLIRLIPAIVWEADGEDYRMTFVSDRCRDLLGYEPEQWLSEPGFWEAHLHPDDRVEAIAAADLAVEGVDETRIDYRFRAADGSYRWFHDAIQVMRDARGQRRLVGVMVDVTERKALEERLAYQAAHDALTGLYNRAELLESAQAVLDQPGRGMVALLFFDLDEFKRVNDDLGHAAGDEVLRVVARRLGRTVRPGDIVGRLGGDEFVVVVAQSTRVSARTQASRLRRRIAEPIEMDGRRVSLRASVGIAVAAPGELIDGLLKRADQAMYRAKARSRVRRVHKALGPTRGAVRS